MKPHRQPRRSWNWPRVLRKCRSGLVAVLASLPLLIFVGIIYVLMAMEHLVNLVYRRIFGSRPAEGAHTRAHLVSQQTGPSHKRVAVLHPGVAGHPVASTSRIAETAENQRASAESVERAREAANRSVLANLELCLSPAAVQAVAEAALDRRELYWPALEGAFARLVDLDATAGDVRELMRICRYEWLYEMPMEPRRIIRLSESPRSGRVRWRHAATHLICFEYDGGLEFGELLPPVENRFARNQIRMLFNSRGHLVHWERPFVSRRRGL